MSNIDSQDDQTIHSGQTDEVPQVTVQLNTLNEELTSVDSADERNYFLDLLIHSLQINQDSLVEGIRSGNSDQVRDIRHKLYTTFRMVDPQPLRGMVEQAARPDATPDPQLADSIAITLRATIKLLDAQKLN